MLTFFWLGVLYIEQIISLNGYMHNRCEQVVAIKGEPILLRSTISYSGQGITIRLPKDDHPRLDVYVKDGSPLIGIKFLSDRPLMMNFKRKPPVLKLLENEASYSQYTFIPLRNIDEQLQLVPFFQNTVTVVNHRITGVEHLRFYGPIHLETAEVTDKRLGDARATLKKIIYDTERPSLSILSSYVRNCKAVELRSCYFSILDQQNEYQFQHTFQLEAIAAKDHQRMNALLINDILASTPSSLSAFYAWHHHYLPHPTKAEILKFANSPNPIVKMLALSTFEQHFSEKDTSLILHDLKQWLQGKTTVSNACNQAYVKLLTGDKNDSKTNSLIKTVSAEDFVNLYLRLQNSKEPLAKVRHQQLISHVFTANTASSRSPTMYDAICLLSSIETGTAMNVIKLIATESVVAELANIAKARVKSPK
jgi:hypothetical protein